MELAAFLSFVLIANAPITEDSWALTFLNYGIAGAMLIFFIWRDKRTEDRRDKEREKAYELQEGNTKALNLMTRGLMVEVIALRHLDGTTKDLAVKIQEQADAAISASQQR